MKKSSIIKLVIGSLLLIGGIGNFPTDIGPAIFGILVGGGLILSEIKPWKKHSNTEPHDPEYSPPAPTSLTGNLAGIDIRIDVADKSEKTIDTYKLSEKEILCAKSYYVVDVETTGLSRAQDRIIELAWLRVEDGSIVDRYSTLIDPECPISPSASAVNGIFDADVKGAPKYADIRQKVAEALIGSTVVGHNVTFDLGFLTQLIGATEGRILYIDTYHLSKRVFPFLSGYKLEQLCNTLHLESKSSHRAMDDVQATLELFNLCRAELRQKEEEAKLERKAQKEEQEAKRKELFGNSPLYNIAFAYTGVFVSQREEIEALAPSVGALIRTKISSKTDYLVAGDISTLPEWAYQRKMGKAKEIIANGGKIKIITEQEYLDLINNAKAVLIQSIEKTN